MSETPEVVKRKPGRPPKAAPVQEPPKEVRTRAPRLPIAVRERRLQNPFGGVDAHIRLKEDGWNTHWINSELHAGNAVWRAKDAGYTDVTLDQVADKDTLGTFTLDGGVICRGERGRERLMKIPEADYQEIQMAKAQKNIDAMRRGTQKQEVAQAVAQRFGDQAGEFVGKTRMVGTIRDSYERVQRSQEIDE